MSNARRRARAGGVVRTGGESPLELTDPDHVVWSDPDAVERLATVYDVDYIEPSPSSLRDPYWERFRVFRRAYAERYKFIKNDDGLDIGSLSAAGIFAADRGRKWQLAPNGDVLHIR